MIYRCVSGTPTLEPRAGSSTGTAGVSIVSPSTTIRLVSRRRAAPDPYACSPSKSDVYFIKSRHTTTRDVVPSAATLGSSQVVVILVFLFFSTPRRSLKYDELLIRRHLTSSVSISTRRLATSRLERESLIKDVVRIVFTFSKL